MQSPANPAKPTRRQWLVAACAYTVAALAVTWPLVTRLGDLLALNVVDHVQHMWSLWWFRHALLDLHAWPGDVSVLNAPLGMPHAMLWAMPLVHLASIPMQLVFGLARTYNLIILVSIPLCGLAAYRLAFELAADRPRAHKAALVAGAVWAFFPGKLIHLDGHFLQLPVMCLPLYVLALWRLLHDPRPKHAILCGVWGALSCLTHIMHAAYFVLPMTVALLLYAWRRRDTLLTKRTLAMLALGGAIGLLILWPFYGPYIRAGLGGSSYDYEGGDLHLVPDLLQLVTPAAVHPLWSRIGFVERRLAALTPTYGNLAESTTYLGWVTMILAGVGIASRKKASRVWWMTATAMALLSLGPLLRVAGELVEVDVEGLRGFVVLPYYWLDQLPLIGVGRTPGRMNETVMLCLAILAGWGVQRLLTKVERTALTHALTAALCLAIVFDGLVWLPLPMIDIPDSLAAASLADDPDGSIVAAAPRFYVNNGLEPIEAENLDMLHQTAHDLSIASGVIHRWRLAQKGYALALDELLIPQRELDAILQPEGTDTLATLRMLGIRQVMVPLPASEAASAEQAALLDAYALPVPDVDTAKRLAAEHLTAVLGEPQSDRDTLVYEVGFGAYDRQAATLIYLGEGWARDPLVTESPQRTLLGDGEIHVMRAAPTIARLTFTAEGPGPDALALRVNGVTVQVAGRERIGKRWRSEPFRLVTGENLLVLQGGSPDDEQALALSEITLDLDVDVDASRSKAVFGSSSDKGDVWHFCSLEDVRYDDTGETGDRFDVKVDWRAMGGRPSGHKVFIHLVGEDGAPVAQHDGYVGGGVRMAAWPDGALIGDRYDLRLPEDLPSGEYMLLMGLYDETTMARAEVSDTAYEVQAGALVLGAVMVE